MLVLLRLKRTSLVIGEKPPQRCVFCYRLNPRVKMPAQVQESVFLPRETLGIPLELAGEVYERTLAGAEFQIVLTHQHDGRLENVPREILERGLKAALTRATVLLRDYPTVVVTALRSHGVPGLAGHAHWYVLALDMEPSAECLACRITEEGETVETSPNFRLVVSQSLTPYECAVVYGRHGATRPEILKVVASKFFEHVLRLTRAYVELYGSRVSVSFTTVLDERNRHPALLVRRENPDTWPLSVLEYLGVRVSFEFPDEWAEQFREVLKRVTSA